MLQVSSILASASPSSAQFWPCITAPGGHHLRIGLPDLPHHPLGQPGEQRPFAAGQELRPLSRPGYSLWQLSSQDPPQGLDAGQHGSWGLDEEAGAGGHEL